MAMVDILREDQEMVVLTVVILLEAQMETMVVIHPVVQMVMATVMEVMDKMKITNLRNTNSLMK